MNFFNKLVLANLLNIKFNSIFAPRFKKEIFEKIF